MVKEIVEDPAVIEAGDRSLTDIAYDAIQKMIVTGRLGTHQLISESELGRELGCGRTPVREALQRLKFEGFVEVLPRRGILVTAADVTGQLELLEMRRPLEKLVVSLAAKRAKPKQKQAMLHLADELERAIKENDIEHYLDINKMIHEIQAEATGNRFLKNQITVVHNLSRRFWYASISDTDSFSIAAKHHAATLRAIAAGDETGAMESNCALLDCLEKATKDSIRGIG
ncbi:GntR family transcriptional regulator [Sulfitobacter mediterraneus]|jgi:DNA-binding GntR family transcriptional regulator|uniref:GntR family transcriptional regulator n=1 Tax=Sulfitobacter TaxID=60136 RepID=UPI001931C93C|nr:MULTISPECIES: GntR family transcriptional regulator [Sulfitobacter]MBM1633990.1 GntR family transcriptional regulator [Sulfitobacter mediterraneus]MBM1641494.1 GntR family transcriptional regulator [Sulfitobacter mediterraneus]MBM1645855.1 GntR family transcriptional regulator [Sulfitobacter mediterraneus]MBM1649614.1 GntR family transcriptional regulator [Sulfitobacter mediterraneus]MBM1653924.1 GntR family transcriptional regulator [Sulfitobacter mediterraneus]